MRDHYEEIRRLNGEVLVISFAFDLERASWREILRSRVMWGYLRLMVRGWAPQRGNKGEDVLQLGGDFVLDEARRLVYAHRSAEPTDRPPVAELIQAVAMAARSRS